MNLQEYINYDALGLADLVKRGEVTAAELQHCAMQGIESLNSELNAVVEIITPADRMIQTPVIDAGLYGVPFLIKDLVLHRAGGKLELGSRLARGMVTPHDTALMAGFRRSGLVTIGRTNSPEFGHSCTTEPVLNGPTRNPWDTGCMAGGSSGGSAAAVAAGIVPAAHANDGAGSIRNPASCCGIFGLKPTRGRVSPGPDYGDPLLGNGVELAVTRSVRDMAAILDAVSGYVPGDPQIAPPPKESFSAAMRRESGRLKIAFTTTTWSGTAIDKEVAEATRRTAALCESLGHSVEEGSPQFDYEQFRAASIKAWAIFIAAGAIGLSKLGGRAISTETLESATYAMCRYGESLSGLDLIDAMAAFNRVSRQVAPFFSDYDLLLTPVTAKPPQPLGTYNQNAAGLTPESWFDRKGAFTPFLAIFNCTGQPAMSVPLQWSDAGLPLGMQFVGPFGREDLLLNFARQLEQAQPWFQKHPRTSLWLTTKTEKIEKRG